VLYEDTLKKVRNQREIIDQQERMADEREKLLQEERELMELRKRVEKHRRAVERKPHYRRAKDDSSLSPSPERSIEYEDPRYF
jgi:hypothetical protein